MVTLRAITGDSFDAVIAMMRPEGEGIVAPNSMSLAQSAGTTAACSSAPSVPEKRRWASS